MATITKIPAPDARLWNLRLPTGPMAVFYECDDEETSIMHFTPYKDKAERFTLAEAEHFVAVAKAQFHSEFSIVSAGGGEALAQVEAAL